jgi:hypothetical protein
MELENNIRQRYGYPFKNNLFYTRYCQIGKDTELNLKPTHKHMILYTLLPNRVRY